LSSLAVRLFHSFPTRRSSDLHIFIDAFNAYGIGLLEPFSAFRLSFHSLYVVDPLFSIWIILAALVLLVFNSTRLVRIRWALLSRSEEHTSELQSRENLVCRLL